MSSRRKLKAYVWEGVLNDWTSGMVVVFDYSKKEALKQLREEHGNSTYEECKGEIPVTPRGRTVFLVRGGS